MTLSCYKHLFFMPGFFDLAKTVKLKTWLFLKGTRATQMRAEYETTDSSPKQITTLTQPNPAPYPSTISREDTRSSLRCSSPSLHSRHTSRPPAMSLHRLPTPHVHLRGIIEITKITEGRVPADGAEKERGADPAAFSQH